MKSLIRSILVLAVICPSIGFGQQQNKAGTAAAQFLKIGVGARAVGMAGTTAGLINDVSALYWNPSGLVHVPSISLFAAHSEWFADIDHQYFGIVLPVGDDHRIGISATVLTMGDMEITTELEPRGTGNFFSATDVAVGVTYAARFVNFFSFGATLKYVSQNIYNESATGIAIDLGTTLITGFNGITVGMAFTNFGTTMKLEGRDLHRTYDPNPTNATNVGVSSFLATEAWEMPINFRVGIGWEAVGSYDSMLPDEMHTVRVGIDANHPNDGPENAAVGIEYQWNNILSLRTGYHINDDVRNLTYGLGVQWASPGSLSLGFDYASMDLDPLGQVHIFSVIIGF